ncbi:alpha/beta fold hydrolase [Rhizobium sp. 18065]|uniref:alpha/beta hydrolase family protein n=1 Tax=Rhizobium sp. 18065 TaxID=2681411 RepID=UPI00135AF437|nr:alpha/beta fold hydrolase [Rhizobium sp. 18065]
MQETRTELLCADGVRLAGDWWLPSAGEPVATVVINPATGVLARYYHHYARFLARYGFSVFTYDYRGIGQSRPADLRSVAYTWRQWGQQDFDAALCHALDRDETGRVLVVGHSIGGFLPGYASMAHRISGLLSVGGQYGYWGDYQLSRRLPMALKWHLAMPAITAVLGYFPGKRLGWLEDLPKGVALGWGLQQDRAEQGLKAEDAIEMRRGFAALTGPILAVSMSDDPIATPKAINRAMAYYTGASIAKVHLSPKDLGFDTVGHFNLFHARHEQGFWKSSLDWLREGRNPWSQRTCL